MIEVGGEVRTSGKNYTKKRIGELALKIQMKNLHQTLIQ